MLIFFFFFYGAAFEIKFAASLCCSELLHRSFCPAVCVFGSSGGFCRKFEELKSDGVGYNLKTQKAHAAAMFAEFSCEFSSSLATEKKGWLELFGRSLNILVK